VAYVLGSCAAAASLISNAVRRSAFRCAGSAPFPRTARLRPAPAPRLRSAAPCTRRVRARPALRTLPCRHRLPHEAGGRLHGVGLLAASREGEHGQVGDGRRQIYAVEDPHVLTRRVRNTTSLGMGSRRGHPNRTATH
jgi:hypothetical protein